MFFPHNCMKIYRMVHNQYFFTISNWLWPKNLFFKRVVGKFYLRTVNKIKKGSHNYDFEESLLCTSSALQEVISFFVELNIFLSSCAIKRLLRNIHRAQLGSFKQEQIWFDISYFSLFSSCLLPRFG